MLRVQRSQGTKSAILVLALSAIISSLPACSDESSEIVAQLPGSASTSKPTTVTEAELTKTEKSLLHLAEKVSSSVPMNPHKKTRSRLQDEVVGALIEAGRLEEATKLADQIHDWRAAHGLARVACVRAEKGDTNGARNLVNRAKNRLNAAAAVETQSWRLDRVRASIAETELRLGNEGEAERLAADLGETEWGTLDRVRYETLPESAFERCIENLDEVFKTASLDQARAALDGLVVLRGRFYAKTEWRAALEKRVLESYAKLPIDIRLNLMIRMVNQSIEHENLDEALAIVAKARELAAVGKWLPEARIPFNARIAALLFRAGDKEGGSKLIAEALNDYAESRPRITDIFRGQALRPLAESYADMGDATQAMVVYRMALEEAQVNPNSRPRAEDLTALCISILNSGLEIDDEFDGLLKAAYGRLGQPW